MHENPKLPAIGLLFPFQSAERRVAFVATPDEVTVRRLLSLMDAAASLGEGHSDVPCVRIMGTQVNLFETMGLAERADAQFERSYESATAALTLAGDWGEENEFYECDLDLSWVISQQSAYPEAVLYPGGDGVPEYVSGPATVDRARLEAYLCWLSPTPERLRQHLPALLEEDPALLVSVLRAHGDTLDSVLDTEALALLLQSPDPQMRTEAIALSGRTRARSLSAETPVAPEARGVVPPQPARF